MHEEALIEYVLCVQEARDPHRGGATTYLRGNGWVGAGTDNEKHEREDERAWLPYKSAQNSLKLASEVIFAKKFWGGHAPRPP